MQPKSLRWKLRTNVTSINSVHLSSTQNSLLKANSEQGSGSGMRPHHCWEYFINGSGGRLYCTAACEEQGEVVLTNKKTWKELFQHNLSSETPSICKTISLLCSALPLEQCCFHLDTLKLKSRQHQTVNATVLDSLLRQIFSCSQGSRSWTKVQRLLSFKSAIRFPLPLVAWDWDITALQMRD